MRGLIDLPDRIQEKIVVDPGSACWWWTAFTNDDGYGTLQVDGKSRPAHRAIYEILVAPIPSELHSDHLCRNPSCVNPRHIEPVTPAENNRRMLAFRIPPTHCKRGHEFTPENAIYDRRSGVRRKCRICAYGDQKRYKDRRRAEQMTTRCEAIVGPAQRWTPSRWSQCSHPATDERCGRNVCSKHAASADRGARPLTFLRAIGFGDAGVA